MNAYVRRRREYGAYLQLINPHHITADFGKMVVYCLMSCQQLKQYWDLLGIESQGAQSLDNSSTGEAFQVPSTPKKVAVTVAFDEAVCKIDALVMWLYFEGYLLDLSLLQEKILNDCTPISSPPPPPLLVYDQIILVHGH